MLTDCFTACVQSSKLDYVVNPQPDEALAAAAATVQGTSKKDEGKFAKKMREVGEQGWQAAYWEVSRSCEMVLVGRYTLT
jgi:hypothetical protein